MISQTFFIFDDLDSLKSADEMCFVGCQPLGICLTFFLWLERDIMWFFEEDCRSKCHFHHTVSRIHSVDLSLLMLISIIRLSGICQASPLWSVLSYLFLLCTPEGSCLVQARLDADIAFLPFEGRVSYALLRILHKRFVYCPSLTHFSTQSFIYINVD